MTNAIGGMVIMGGMPIVASINYANFNYIGLVLLFVMLFSIPKTAFKYSRIMVSFLVALYSTVFLYLLSVQAVTGNRFYLYDGIIFALVVCFLIYRPYTFSLVTKREYYLDFEAVHKSIVLIILIVYIYFRRISIGLVWNFGIRAWLQTIIFTGSIVGVISYIALRIKLVKKIEFIKTGLKEFVVTAVNMFFFVALPEEILFRGLLYGYMYQLLGNFFLAIVLTTIIFSITHRRYGIQMIYLGGIAGLFYNILYVLTGNIYCATIMHVGVNLYRKYFLK